MNHKVFINSDDYIEVVYNGAITQQENKLVMDEIMNRAIKLEDQGKKVKILIDNTNVEQVDPSVLDFSSLAMRDLPYEKLAGFGADEAATKDIMKIILSSEVKDKVKLVVTREEAEQWLKD